MAYSFPEKVFPSRINPYLRCPLQFKYKNDDEIEVEFEERPATFIGKAIHDALERFFDISATPIDQRESIDTRDLIREMWGEVKNNQTGESFTREEREKLFGSREQERAFGLKSVRILNNYLRGADLTTVPLELEDWIDCELGEFILAGRVDRLDQEDDGTIAIWDYKTGKLPYHKKIEEMMKHSFQIPIYSIIASKRYPGAEKIRAGLIYVKYSKTYDKVWERDELKELENEIEGKLKEVKERKEFPPKKNKLCDWCDYKDMCPIYE